MLRKWLRYLSVIMLVAMILTSAGCSSSTQSSAETTSKQVTADVLKGKVVTFIVPYDTGGGYDAKARLLAPYLQKNLPGSTVTVSNVPGAGSLTGTNQLYEAKPDGQTIGILNTAGIISAQATNGKGVRFDVNKFTWLGRIDTDPEILVMRPDSGITSFEQLVNSSKNIKIGLTGVGSAAFNSMKALANSGNLKNVQLVSGYNSSNESVVAMMRGEVQGTMTVLSSLQTVFKQNAGTPIVVLAAKRLTDWPNVPLASEVVSAENKQVMSSMLALLDSGYSVAAPPNMDPGLAKVLRDAFAQAMKDPEFINNSNKASRPISYLNDADELKLVQEAMKMPDSLKAVLAASN